MAFAASIAFFSNRDLPDHAGLGAFSGRASASVGSGQSMTSVVGSRRAPLPLVLAGAGALVINLSCDFMLARYRVHGGSLTRAAFLSSRNDFFANVGIIAAGLVTGSL